MGGVLGESEDGKLKRRPLREDTGPFTFLWPLKGDLSLWKGRPSEDWGARTSRKIGTTPAENGV